MRFDPLTPIGEWKAVGVRLVLHAEATCWWLGDWLAFGQMKYGRHYKEGVALTGLDYQTLRNTPSSPAASSCPAGGTP
jgi:hypothetical protein